MTEAVSALLARTPLVVSDDDARPSAGRQSRWLLPGVALLCAGVPLAVALIVLRNPRWYPALDLAQIELRIRDVGTPDRPLVGLPGRIYGRGEYGSHPGPLGFWLLWPFYRLYGGTAWAMQAAAATLNLIAAGVVLWIAHRRGSTPAVFGVAVALTLLMRAYGFELLTVPWNPYLPLLWWLVFLLAVWSILCDDLAMVPVAVVAAALCTQTHVPYVPLVAGVGGFAAVTLAVQTWRGPRPIPWRRLARWVLPAFGLFVVLWSPPMIEQARPGTGNLGIIVDAFTRPVEPPLGVGGEAVRIWLGYLDVWGILAPYRSTVAQDTTLLPGLITVAVWVAAVVVAWRLRHRDLLRLHLVVAAALVSGFVAVTKILGITWFWLLLWGWGTTTLLVIATAWTAAVALRGTRWTAWLTPRWGLVAVVGAAGLLTYDATGATLPDAEVRDSTRLAHITPATVDALRAGDIPGTGPDGRYVLEMDQDPFTLGSSGQGLLLELERQGLDVGVGDVQSKALTIHRRRPRAESTAVLHLVVGDAAIAKMRARGDLDLTEVAFYEPRTPEVRRAFERDRAAVTEDLRRIGRDDVAAMMSTIIIGALIDRTLPEDMLGRIGDLLEYPQPAAVFVQPTG